MNNIQVFNNPQFGQVRTVSINNEPYFVGKDVAIVLGYENTNDAIITNVDEEDRTVIQLSDLQQGSQQLPPHMKSSKIGIINESGVYSLILRSRLESAKEFKKLVTSEVLPSIRKTGGYISTSSEDTPEQILAKAVLVAQRTIEQMYEKIVHLDLEKERLQIANELQEVELKQQAPKIHYYNDVISSSSLLTIDIIANDLGISAIKLNKILCNEKIQHKQGSTYVLYEKYRDMGLVQHVPYCYIDKEGYNKTSQHMKWTEKGREFIMSMFVVD